VADTKTNLELLDLKASLEAFEFDADTDEGKLLSAASQLMNKLGLTDDLTLLSDTQLKAADTVTYVRIAYVLALMRVLSYLRNPSQDIHAQARMGLDYVKHIQSSGLKEAQLGRNVKDGVLAEAVANLRREVNTLASYKAKALANGKPKAEA